MSFTQGQLYFALAFIIVFLVAIIFAYRKDESVRKVHYKGVYQLVLLIVGIFLGYFILVKALG